MKYLQNRTLNVLTQEIVPSNQLVKQELKNDLDSVPTTACLAPSPFGQLNLPTQKGLPRCPKTITLPYFIFLIALITI